MSHALKRVTLPYVGVLLALLLAFFVGPALAQTTDTAFSPPGEPQECASPLSPSSSQETDLKDHLFPPENEESPQSPAPHGRAPLSYPRLSPHGQIQIQVDGGSLGSPKASSAFPSSGSLSPYEARSHAFIRRLRPGLTFELSDYFKIQGVLDISPSKDQVQILDLRADLDLSPATVLSMGRFKVPFGWEGGLSSMSTPTVERSEVTSSLYSQRAVGLMLSHEEPALGEFWLGSFLGRRLGNDGFSHHYDVLGRALFHLNDEIKFGVSGQLGTYSSPDGLNPESFPIRRFGTEFHYSTGSLQFGAEAIYSDGYNPTARTNTQAFGYLASANFRLNSNFDLRLHYDRFDPNLNATNLNIVSNETNARDRKVVGLSYAFNRKARHKIMLDYEFRQSLEGPSLHTQGPRLRYQIGW